MSGALNSSEIRIMLLVSRKTHGFQKQKDAISYSQFQKILGVCRNTAINKIKNLVQVGLLVKGKGNKNVPNNWQIDLTNYTSKVVQMTELVQVDDKKVVQLRGIHKRKLTKESLASSTNSYKKGNISQTLKCPEDKDSLIWEKTLDEYHRIKKERPDYEIKSIPRLLNKIYSDNAGVKKENDLAREKARLHDERMYPTIIN